MRLKIASIKSNFFSFVLETHMKCSKYLFQMYLFAIIRTDVIEDVLSLIQGGL